MLRFWTFRDIGTSYLCVTISFGTLRTFMFLYRHTVQLMPDAHTLVYELGLELMRVGVLMTYLKGHVTYGLHVCYAFILLL